MQSGSRMACAQKARLRGEVRSRRGWRLKVNRRTKWRTLVNFPVQSAGADILQLACCLSTEAGIDVCAPVHDALLIQSSVAEIERTVEATRHVMAQASRSVLSGFELRTDADVVRHPARYFDEGGKAMWDKIVGILETIGSSNDLER